MKNPTSSKGFPKGVFIMMFLLMIALGVIIGKNIPIEKVQLTLSIFVVTFPSSILILNYLRKLLI